MRINDKDLWFYLIQNSKDYQGSQEPPKTYSWKGRQWYEMDICIGGNVPGRVANDENFVLAGITEGHPHFLKHPRIVDGLEE